MTFFGDVATTLGEQLAPNAIRVVTRRMGVVTVAPSGTPPTLTASVGGTTIAGIRMLGPLRPAVGENVIIDFYGSDPLVLGKLDSGVVVNDAAGYFPPARVGPSPQSAYGSAYASVDHTGRTWTAVGNYVLLADTLHTFLNAPATGQVHMRVNNTEQATFGPSGNVTYQQGTELTVSDTNTFRSNYGLTVPYNAPLFLRGFADNNHRLVVPTIAAQYGSVFNVDGFLQVCFSNGMVATGINAHWQTSTFANGFTVFGNIVVGGSSSNDYQVDTEGITTYGGSGGISIRQRTRSWNDGANRVVLYADNDTFHIWQGGRLLTIGVNANGIDLTSSAYIAVPPLLGGNTMNLQAGGSWQIGYVSSSAKHKENVRDLDTTGPDNPLWALRAVRFTWNADYVLNAAEGNERHPDGVAGLIAEEVAELMPDAAIYAGPNPHGCPRGDGVSEGDAIGLDNDRLIAYLVDAVQYLRTELERRTHGHAA